jgi:predicted GNAT family acetyltransferase
LSPQSFWIAKTWGGPAGLAASGAAWGAFVDGRLVSVACTFFMGERYEEIGVVTEPEHRGQGLSVACTRALCLAIFARGRRPSWTTSPDNTASVRVAEKLGFRLDRHDWLYVAGIPVPEPARTNEE